MDYILQHYRLRSFFPFLLLLLFLTVPLIVLAAPSTNATTSTVEEGATPILPDVASLNAIPATAGLASIDPQITVDSFNSGLVVLRLKYLRADQVKSLINLIVADDKIRVEPVNNSIIIMANEFERQDINTLISQIDIPPIQVMFEAEAVEISRNDLKNIGIDWENITPLPDVLTNDTGSAFRIGLGIPNHPEYGINVLGKINRLIENKKGKLLASPRIAALNGTTAQILIGDKLAVEASSVNGSVTTTTVTYVDVGIKLEVTPFVNDDGTITAHIKPEVSNKTDVTVHGNPNIRTRQAETTVRVKNGETIVLGGLMQKQETRDTFKVPLLGDLPLIGGFFRTEKNEKTETELVILITPKVISQ